MGLVIMTLTVRATQDSDGRRFKFLASDWSAAENPAFPLVEISNLRAPSEPEPRIQGHTVFGSPVLIC